MALVKYEKNGRGYYDFNDLLNATSVEFVDYVTRYIEIIQLKNYNDRQTVKVEFNSTMTTVYVIENIGTPIVSIFKYYKETNTINEICLNLYELKMLMGELNE